MVQALAVVLESTVAVVVVFVVLEENSLHLQRAILTGDSLVGFKFW